MVVVRFSNPRTYSQLKAPSVTLRSVFDSPAVTDYRIASAATFLPSTWKVCSQSLPGMLQYPPKINTGRAAAAFQAMAHGVQFGIVG